MIKYVDCFYSPHYENYWSMAYYCTEWDKIYRSRIIEFKLVVRI